MTVNTTTSGARRKSTFPALSKLAARCVELALIALIAFMSAQAVWFVIYGDAVRPLNLNTQTALGSGSTARVSDLSELGQSGLFAVRGSLEPVVAQIAPETRLNLTLRGLRSGPDPRSGAAFIEAPNLGQRSYAPGDEITSGVTLVEIYGDRVIINRRGARESLFISADAAERARAGQTRQRELQDGELIQAQVRPGTVPQPVARPATGASPLSGEPDLELAASLDVEDWVEGLRFTPYSQGGPIIGFVVRDNSHLEVLRAAGLMPGDVITELNGERLVDADAARRALASFETEDRISMTLTRNGAPVQINVPLHSSGHGRD